MIALLKAPYQYTDPCPYNDVHSYNLIPSLFSKQITQSIYDFIKHLETIATQVRSLQSVDSSPSDIQLEEWILNVICNVIQAEQIQRVNYDLEGQKWIFKEKSQYFSTDRTTALPFSFFNQHILTNYLDIQESHQGIYQVIFSHQSQTHKAYSLIPLSESQSYLLISGLTVEPNPFSGEYESPFLNDTFTHLIASFYQEARSYYQPYSDHLNHQLLLIESRILDNLKDRYGFISKVLYDRRFLLFEYCLDQIEIHFEPIFDLQSMCVYGWEALARNPLTGKAPTDLFHASELWGFQFTIVLDTTLLRKALFTYRQLLEENQIPLETPPLFVNVYPESLMSSTFFDELESLTQGLDKLIEPRNLTLEISEKKQLPFCVESPRDPISLETFKQRLNEYTHRLGINFGIDDFGVGYSSVHRFTGLNLTYIKIDREILYQEPFDAVIRFVQEVINFASPEVRSEIIVEGLDASSPITLEQLKALGVRFVQGYLIGKATTDLNLHLPHCDRS